LERTPGKKVSTLFPGFGAYGNGAAFVEWARSAIFLGTLGGGGMLFALVSRGKKIGTRCSRIPFQTTGIN